VAGLAGADEGDTAEVCIAALDGARDGDCGGGAGIDEETFVEVGGKGTVIDDGEGTGDELISASAPKGTTGVGEGKANGVAEGKGEVVGTIALPNTAKVVKWGIKTVMVSVTESTIT